MRLNKMQSGTREKIIETLKGLSPNWFNLKQIISLTGLGNTSVYYQLRKLDYWHEIESKLVKCRSGYKKVWRYVENDN